MKIKIFLLYNNFIWMNSSFVGINCNFMPKLDVFRSKSKTLVHGSFNKFLLISRVSIIQKSVAVGRQTDPILLAKSSFI